MSFKNAKKKVAVQTDDLYPVRFGDDIVVYVRHVQSAKSQKARREAERKYRGTLQQAERKGEDIPDEVAYDIMLDHLANGIVADWEGVYDDDGQLASCTPENVRSFLSDDDPTEDQNLEPFRTEIFNEARRDANFRAVQETEEGKGSSGSERTGTES